MSNPMNREFCPRCSIKHIAQARALMKEISKGYPEHVWYAMGHLAEAEDEIVDYMPEEANTIRDQRLQMQQALDASAEAPEYYVPDFQHLLRTVAEGAMLPEAQYIGQETWNQLS